MSWTKVLPQRELPAGARKVARLKARRPWSFGLGRRVNVLSCEEARPVFPTKIDAGYIWVNLDDSP